MVNRLALLVLAFVVAAPLASAAPGVAIFGGSANDLPELSIDDATVTEGNSGTVTATFTVTLSSASDQIVTALFATADDTASAPDDYLPAGGPLIFEPGQTTQTVDVTVNGDTIDEVDETYFVNLSEAFNATISDGQGLGTITDDDVPSISIADAIVTEGDS